MALAKRLGHDPLGSSKKHDAPRSLRPPVPSRLSWNFRRRRLILIAVVLVAVFFFVKYLPTDVAPVGRRYDPRFGSMAPGAVQAQMGMKDEKISKKPNGPNQLYDGPIRFNELPPTLRPHMSWPREDNILFAVTSPRSASNLIPFACQMAHNNRSTIHVVLLGRQAVTIEELLKVNGLAPEECTVYWHDATPDHSLESSRSRIESSIQEGLGHCLTAIRPQVVLTDDLEGENTLASSPVKNAAAAARAPLITLPSDSQQSLPWLAALDSNSLKWFAEIQIEIVVQAYSESAGSLVRLLRSIQNANYRGLTRPRVTIDLPSRVDTFVMSYLAGFKWPPWSTPATSQVTLRHRINSKLLTSAEASLRTIESFYPQSPGLSHVLVLSPNTELSPNYLHYLMFTLLEYKYGGISYGQSDILFGISLELPSKRLDGESPFVASPPSKDQPFLLSQTPNNGAILVMGDKWLELHTFLAQRFLHDPDLEIKSEAAKSITRDYPGWLAEALDFMQAKGLYTLYPLFASEDDLKLVTLHKDLFQPPEEYFTVDSSRKPAESLGVGKIAQDEVLSGDSQSVPASDNTAHASPLLPLQMMLSTDTTTSQRTLPVLADLPMRNFGGTTTDWLESRTAAEKFATDFSIHQGGCASADARDRKKQGRIEYLFCSPG